MSMETVRTIRDEEPRTATSTFTQLLSSDADKFKIALDSDSLFTKFYNKE